MVQQYYLIYCMPVHVYELVPHCTRQATVDFVSMYSLGQSHPPYCLYCMSLLRTGLSRELNETGGRLREHKQ